MNKVATPSRWFPGWRTAARPMQDDPADLGTAFGLEVSLEMSLNEIAAAEAAREQALAPASARGTRRPGLMQRLTGRRKTAD